MPFYEDAFIMNLPDDLVQGLREILGKYFDFEDARGDDRPPLDEVLQETRFLVLALSEARVVPPELGLPIARVKDAADQGTYLALKKLHEETWVFVKREGERATQNRIRSLLTAGFHYEFSEADTNRIQLLINELRKAIAQAEGFDPKFRQRLLARLESLQGEVHRRLTNLDKFFGLIGDAGVLLGKFGKDAKPFVDRIGEIAEIVWRAQANAEQLPASARPALLRTDDDEPA